MQAGRPLTLPRHLPLLLLACPVGICFFFPCLLVRFPESFFSPSLRTRFSHLPPPRPLPLPCSVWRRGKGTGSRGNVLRCGVLSPCASLRALLLLPSFLPRLPAWLCPSYASEEEGRKQRAASGHFLPFFSPPTRRASIFLPSFFPKLSLWCCCTRRSWYLQPPPAEHEMRQV